MDSVAVLEAMAFGFLVGLPGLRFGLVPGSFDGMAVFPSESASLSLVPDLVVIPVVDAVLEMDDLRDAGPDVDYWNLDGPGAEGAERGPTSLTPRRRRRRPPSWFSCEWRGTGPGRLRRASWLKWDQPVSRTRPLYLALVLCTFRVHPRCVLRRELEGLALLPVLRVQVRGFIVLYLVPVPVIVVKIVVEYCLFLSASLLVYPVLYVG